MSLFNSGSGREATVPISFKVHWPLVLSVLLLGMAGVLLQY